MGQCGEPGVSVRDWFNRAACAQLDYGDAYSNIATALLPRWGGSHDALYDPGVECLETKRFDTAAPEFVFGAVRMIQDQDQVDYWTRPGVYDNLKALFQGALAEPSQAGRRRELRAIWAIVAWRCGKPDEARRLLDELGDKEGESVAKEYFGPLFSQVKEELYGEGATREAPK